MGIPGTADEQVQRAVMTLRRFGASEVYLFGSRSRGKPRPGSDVDLAVRGLPDEVFIHAIAQASLDTDLPLDVVSLNLSPVSRQKPYLDKVVPRGPAPAAAVTEGVRRTTGVTAAAGGERNSFPHLVPLRPK